MARLLSRRALLRGAGVALALPWLESLAPRAARAQGTPPLRRFLPIFLPNGAANYFRPGGVGQGAAWNLSPVLQPFERLKSKLSVLTNLENYSVFNPDSPSVEPSHGRSPGAFLTCVDGSLVRDRLGVQEANGVSIDQLLAQHPLHAGLTPLASLQVGLSTWYSYCDGKPCSFSRSISWATETQPMYKLVDPREVFDRIVGVTGSAPVAGVDTEAQKRRALDKSVLDAVLENANRTRTRLGVADQKRMDEFLESVRAVERRVTAAGDGMASGRECTPTAAPTLRALPNEPQRTTDTYDKGEHADVMNDLIVMAFQCDATRVISYMLEDERSEYVYSHVPKRRFSAEGSEPGDGVCGNYHGAQHAGDYNDDFSTISWWNTTKVAELCERLDSLEDTPGTSILDNTVVLYAGCMHGGNHQLNELPVALLGKGGGVLRTDQHVVFPETPGDRPLRDLHLTILNHCFGLDLDEVGVDTKGERSRVIEEILA